MIKCPEDLPEAEWLNKVQISVKQGQMEGVTQVCVIMGVKRRTDMD